MPEEIYSPEVRNIISYKPVWIVRNGNMLFLGIMLLMLSVSFIVRYPDIVQAKAVLTSINAPKEVKIKTGGLLVSLKVKEGDEVRSNEILGFLESTASHQKVISLDSILQKMNTAVLSGDIGNAVNLFERFPKSTGDLGEVSADMVSFSTAYRQFSQYLNAGYFLRRRNMLASDLGYLSRLHSYLMQQKQMQEQDVGLAETTLNANKFLDSNKIISAKEYRDEQSKFIAKSMTIPQINAAIVGNESSQHEKDKEIDQLDNEIAQQKEIFRQAIQSLQSAVAEWKSKYLLVSPIAGKVRFTGFIEENQQVTAGQTLCFVAPGNSSFYAQLTIPQSNFGKIEKGQKVKLKFPSYPYQEFGAIEGKLALVNQIPTDSGFVTKVNLPKGLTTNYKKEIVYREGLTASAEIITANTSLAQRIFNQLISLVRN